MSSQSDPDLEEMPAELGSIHGDFRTMAGVMRRRMLRQDDAEYGAVGRVLRPLPVRREQSPSEMSDVSFRAQPMLAVTIPDPHEAVAIVDIDRLQQDSDASSISAIGYHSNLNSDSSTEERLFESMEGDCSSPAQADTFPTLEDEVPDIATKLRAFMSSLKGRHAISWEAQKAIYHFMRQNGEEIGEATRSGKMPSYKTVRRRLEGSLPKTHLRVKYLDQDGDEVLLTDIPQVPKWLMKQRENILQICAYCDLKEIFAFYRTRHTNNTERTSTLSQHKLSLSSDGVQSTNQGSRSLHIVSITLEHCRQPIMWFCWEFLQGHQPSLQELMGPVVQQLGKYGAQLVQVVADGKEQNFLRGMVGTGGYYGCGRCFSKGVTEKASQRNRGRAAKNVHFPLHSLDTTPRTSQWWRGMFEQNPEWFTDQESLAATKNVRFGVCGEVSPP